MARYRALQDIDIGSSWPHVQAGDTLFSGPGGNIPDNWVPPAAVDPLDTDAVQKFWSAGVQLPGLIRAQWSGVSIGGPPVTRWIADPNAGSGNIYRQFVLSGLGVGMPHRQIL